MFTPNVHSNPLNADPKACLCSVISGSPCYLRRLWSGQSVYPFLFFLCLGLHALFVCVMVVKKTLTSGSGSRRGQADTGRLALGQWEMKAAGTQRWLFWMNWTQLFHPRVTVRRGGFFSVFVCFKNKKLISFHIECLYCDVQSPQEELHYSQLRAVKYPCRCSSQIPLRQRQSIIPFSQPHTHTTLSSTRLRKHLLCNVAFFNFFFTNVPSQAASLADSLHTLLHLKTPVSLSLHKYVFDMSLSEVKVFKHSMPTASVCAMSANPLCSPLLPATSSFWR